MIRLARHVDADAIARIYNHYIEHTVISFEEDPVDATEMIRRMGDPAGPWPWLVALDPESAQDGDSESQTIIGYAYASQWSGRAAYRKAAEMSVYLAHDHVARGVGSALYARLLEELRARDIQHGHRRCRST